MRIVLSPRLCKIISIRDDTDLRYHRLLANLVLRCTRVVSLVIHLYVLQAIYNRMSFYDLLLTCILRCCPPLDTVTLLLPVTMRLLFHQVMSGYGEPWRCINTVMASLLYQYQTSATQVISTMPPSSTVALRGLEVMVGGRGGSSVSTWRRNCES